MSIERDKALENDLETGSFEELAASQGVSPVTEFEALLGHAASEDESADDFATMLREWRREGAAAHHQ